MIIYKITILLIAILLSNCDFSVTKPSVFPLLVNLQKMPEQPKSVTLTCETDTPSITTKKITGTVRDKETSAVIANTRVSTEPATTVTLSNTEGVFTILGIDSALTELNVNASASSYELLSETVKITCQNAVITIFMTKVKTAPPGVNPFTLDNTKLDNANIQ